MLADSASSLSFYVTKSSVSVGNQRGNESHGAAYHFEGDDVEADGHLDPVGEIHQGNDPFVVVGHQSLLQPADGLVALLGPNAARDTCNATDKEMAHSQQALPVPTTRAQLA